MAITRLEPLLSQKVFRAASGANAVVALALGVLGSMLSGNPDLRSVHAILAMVFLGTSLVSALSGMRYGKESRTGGIAALGFGVFGVGAIQYALGELAVTWPHMLLGLVVILGAGVLFVRSLQQPVVVTGAGQGVTPPGGTDAAPR